MPLIGTIDMAEATRLTREGRLGEALSLLTGHGATQGGAESPTAAVSRLKAVIMRDGAVPKALQPLREKLQAGLRGALDQLDQVGSRTGLDPGRTPPVPEQARFEAKTYASEQGDLIYKLYVPSQAGSQPLPLVVMLHGCTQSPDDFALGTRMNELAEEEGCYVAYPAQSAMANSSKCWNWFRAGDQQRGRGEPALIAGMVRQIMREVRVDASRIYVAGLSAGGAAGAVLGQTYPELFAAVGVHSGLACGAASDVSSAFSAMKQGAAALRSGSGFVPTIVFHGDRDFDREPRERRTGADAGGGAAVAEDHRRARSFAGRSCLHAHHPVGSR